MGLLKIHKINVDFTVFVDMVVANTLCFALVLFRKIRQSCYNHMFWRWSADANGTGELIPSELSTLTGTYENIYVYNQ